jgi:hypothetical protein
VGSANQVYNPVKTAAQDFAKGDQGWGHLAGEILSSGGNVLAFTVVGALAFGGLLKRPTRWKDGEQQGLQYLEDNAGERFPYERTRGGQRVRILLPMGRSVTHLITDLASRDDDQLAAEVEALVFDNYPSES